MLQTYTKEFNRNLQLAWPIILGLLGHTVVGLVDNIMVGKLGTGPLAAVSLGNSFLFMGMSVILGFSTGITPLVAASDSTNNTKEGKSVLKNGLLLVTGLGVLLTLIIFFIRPLLYHMKQTEEVVKLAIPYLNIVALSLIPLAVFQAFKQFADGLSQTKYSMWATIIANVLNVVLNYVLIYGIWIFPEMGIVGAAWGTLISRVVMAIAMYLYIFKKDKFLVYFENLWKEKFLKTTIKKLNGIGFPSALQMFFEFGIFTAGIWLSGTLGKNPQAANQIALNLSSMTFMFAMGLAVVATIRVGNQFGLKSFKELRRIAFSIFLLILIMDVIFAIFFMIYNEFLPTLYLDVNDVANKQDNTEVITITAKLMIIAAFFQLFDGMQAVVLGALKGMQDVKIPTAITFVAYWIISFPICYLAGISFGYGSEGIWLGFLVGLGASAVMLLWRFQVVTKRELLKS
ncbi:MATE family efflux transporter [Flavobacteriales bacterium]|nr:MATE family efflux transporter [Flavobacteriales bacterium]MDC1370205.1 MATE family efflux transporter [Flavobacteriales bacterium]